MRISAREMMTLRARSFSRRGGETGRRTGLKILRSQKDRVGSIPTPGTNRINNLRASTVRRILKCDWPVRANCQTTRFIP